MRYYNCNIQALFEIPKREPPKLTETDRWSEDFSHYVSVCLSKKPDQRPTAAALLEHKFMGKASSREDMVAFISKVLCTVFTLNEWF